MKTATVLYVPALHRGYIDFLKKYQNPTHILDLSIVREQPRLERDIRAIDPEEAKKAIDALVIVSSVHILNKDNIKELDGYECLLMPDEDVSREFIKNYFPNKKVEYISVFLRWDKHAALKENNIPNPDRTISTSKFDKEIMGQAYEEAKKSSDWWRSIGALVVKEGKVLLVSHNHPLPSDQVHNIFGDPRSNFDYGVSFELSKFIHAEAGMIAEAAKKGISLDGTSIYVTTFPCPVCAKSIAIAGIKKVFYSEGYSLLDAEDILRSFDVELVKVDLA